MQTGGCTCSVYSSYPFPHTTPTPALQSCVCTPTYSIFGEYNARCGIIFLYIYIPKWYKCLYRFKSSVQAGGYDPLTCRMSGMFGPLPYPPTQVCSQKSQGEVDPQGTLMSIHHPDFVLPDLQSGRNCAE